MLLRTFLSLGFLSFVTFEAPSQAQSLNGWQAEVREIQIPSTADQSLQPALTWSPTTEEARPLLVGLHTWGGDYRQAANGRVYAQWCMDQGWHFVYPNFRGPNRTPAAMGSDLAVQDVVDAVAHLQKSGRVDASRIYLIGVSGGGHMAMQMAGRHPEIWAGVSAWCGISDIAAWHTEHLKNGMPDNYARHIELALGGAPAGKLLTEAAKRSPLTHLARAKGVPLDLNHGIHDGRLGSVPFRHSLLAFNQTAATPLPVAEIQAYYETQQRPAGWPAPETDPLYGPKPVLFRQVSGNTRVTLFEGGHEILYTPSLNWLALQRKGQPAVWTVAKPMPVGGAADTKSGL
ncbi:MAG: prolyl oligopeptidase family serine peptidase [Verrucomicrobiota bacterium]